MEEYISASNRNIEPRQMTGGMKEEKEALKELKEKLEQCSGAARAAVCPLLHLPAMKHLLLSCITDTSKSLEEWIWDTRCQQLLGTVKANAAHMDTQAFNNSYREKILQTNENRVNEEGDWATADHSLLLKTEIMKSEAKTKFQGKNYYGAMKGYLKAVGMLRPRLNALKKMAEDQQREHNTDGKSGIEEGKQGATSHDGMNKESSPDEKPQRNNTNEQGEAKSETHCIDSKETGGQDMHQQNGQEYSSTQDNDISWFYEDDNEEDDVEYFIEKFVSEAISCSCNAAVAGFKAKEYQEVVSACSQALELDPKCSKALYWRARVRIQQKTFDVASEDLKKAAEYEPDNKDIKNYLLKVEQKLKEQRIEWDKINEKSRKKQEQEKEQQDLKTLETKMQAVPISEANRLGSAWPADKDPEEWKAAPWPKETEDPEAIARALGEDVPVAAPVDTTLLPPAEGGSVPWGPEPDETPAWMHYTEHKPEPKKSDEACYNCGSKGHIQRKCPLIHTQLQDPESDWKLPKPPNLREEYLKGSQYTPAMILCNYADKLPVDVSINSEVIEAHKLYRVYINCPGKASVSAEGTSSTKAKQEAAFLFFQECYHLYEEQNPGVKLDYDGLVRPDKSLFPQIEDEFQKQQKKKTQQNMQWFLDLVTLWVDFFAQLTATECNELRFSSDLTKKQRSTVHRLAEDRDLLSFSVGEKRERTITVTRGPRGTGPRDDKLRYILVPPLYMGMTPQRSGLEKCIKEEELKQVVVEDDEEAADLVPN